MHCDVRVTVPNGYGVMQPYSVDVWWGDTMMSTAYVMLGSVRAERPIRKGTKVFARVVEAAKDKVRPYRRP
jgi:hypothetical protein